jgi:hypothetical protein
LSKARLVMVKVIFMVMARVRVRPCARASLT